MEPIRPPFGLYKFFFLLFWAAFFVYFSGCNRETACDSSEPDQLAKRIGDFITSGRFDSADFLLAAEREEALADGDSDRWCSTKVQQAVLNYYLYKPEEMLNAIDSASNYLRKQPENPRRLMMLQKVLQAKGTVYSHFIPVPDSAVYYLRMGADAAERSGNRKEYALALANVADAYKLNSRLDLAADYYHRAILEADSAGFDSHDYVSLYGGLATVYTGLRDFDNSSRWWKKTMDLWPVMIPFERFNNLNNYGTDFYYRKDYEGALRTFQRLNKYLDSIPSSDWEKNFVAVNLSDCYLRLGMTDSVKELIPAATKYFSEIQPNSVALSYLHTLMMRRDANLGDYSSVDNLISRHPFSDTLRPEMQLLRLELLSDYYEKSGRKDLALESYRQYTELDDSIRSVAVNQSIAATRMAYERDKDVLRLRAVNAEQHSRFLWVLVIVSLVIAVLLIFVISLLINRRRVRHREERMLEKIATLRTAAVRSRITPHFIYNALNHEISNRNNGRPSRLEAIVSLLRHQQFVASEIVTTLARELQFTENYILIQAENYGDRLTHEVEIDSSLNPEKLRMPSMLLQILVENAFKHAFPNLPDSEKILLRIKVQTDGSDIRITVFNTAPELETKGAEIMKDSCGLNPSDNSNGTGLRVIMETLKLLRDREHIDIRFTLRLNHHGENPTESGCLASYHFPLSWMLIK